MLAKLEALLSRLDDLAAVSHFDWQHKLLPFDRPRWEKQVAWTLASYTAGSLAGGHQAYIEQEHQDIGFERSTEFNPSKRWFRRPTPPRAA